MLTQGTKPRRGFLSTLNKTKLPFPLLSPAFSTVPLFCASPYSHLCQPKSQPRHCPNAAVPKTRPVPALKWLVADSFACSQSFPSYLGLLPVTSISSTTLFLIVAVPIPYTSFLGLITAHSPTSHRSLSLRLPHVYCRCIKQACITQQRCLICCTLRSRNTEK